VEGHLAELTLRHSQRRMEWSWRGEYYPANRGEFETIRNQLEAERASTPCARLPGLPAHRAMG
jgi:hypothetical protein